MKKLKFYITLYSVAIVLIFYGCKETNQKDQLNPTIKKNTESEKESNEILIQKDSFLLKKTSLLFNEFKSNKSATSKKQSIDSIINTYSKVSNKKASFAYNIYKTLWEYYMDINIHINSVELLEAFIDISKNDIDRDNIKLLEAYSYLGSELTYLGRCDLAIEKSLTPFLELLAEEELTTTDRDQLDFLKTGRLATYVGYLECASLLGDGNLQKQILSDSEQLVYANHDDVPWYNVYKSDLLGKMLTLYLARGNIDKAKIFLGLYKNAFDPQDVIDQMLMEDRKMYFYNELNDLDAFRKAFRSSNTYYTKAIQQFSPDTQEYYLAKKNHAIALERLAIIYAKNKASNPKISSLYHNAIHTIKSLEYDVNINPLGAYKGLISYHKTKKQSDSVSYYLKKHNALSVQLNALDDIWDNKVLYIDYTLSNKNFKETEIILTNYLQSLGIKNLKEFLKDNSKNFIANEKTLFRIVKIAKLLKQKSKENEKLQKHSNQFFLLAAHLLNQLKENQTFNPKEIKLLKDINSGILSTRLGSLQNDDVIIKYIEGNQYLELLQKDANKNIVLKTNDSLTRLIGKRNQLNRNILAFTNNYLKDTFKLDNIGRHKYLDLLRAKDSIKEGIKKKYPNYVFYTSPSFNLNVYKAALNNETATLRFYSTNESSYAYLISKKQLHYYKLGKRKNIKKLIEDLSKKITTQEDLSEIIENLKAFLKPVLSDALDFKNLKIIPQDELSFLPFEVLLDHFSESDISLSYNASLAINNNTKKDKNKTTFAAYAPKYKKNNTENKIIKRIERSGTFELPNAFEEATFISKLFDGDLFSAENATKQHFIEHSKNYSVLHLAMHATVSDTLSNENTMLLFSGNNEEDYLSLNDVYNLQLPVKLTTLSACNTAYGDIDPVEGVLSLSRAFHYAGSSSTVTSLWRVPDKETAQIMKAFYENLKQGYTKSDALKKAKQSYLNNTEDTNLKHPYYWAGFVLTGDTSAIISPINYLPYVIIASILILVIFLAIKRRLKPKS